MLLCCNKYLTHFLQRKIAGIVLFTLFSTAASSQNNLRKDSLLPAPLNPLFVSAYKKPVKLMTLHFNPPFQPYVLKRGGELMHWPSYPLTTGQIIAMQEDWEKRNNRSIGEQIASDIIKSNVNRLIYGRKMPPATIPKF